jgi:acyl carrier protein
VIKRKLLRTIVSLSDAARARVTLGTHVGPGVRLLGTPSIVSQGTLVVGARAVLVSTPAPVTIVIRPNASVEIGEEALVESGAVIRAHGRVVIGRGARVGVGCVVDDETCESELCIPDREWMADGTVVTASGGPSPARAESHVVRADATRERIREVVCGIVSGAWELDDASDLRGAPGFDSLAALRVLVALEKELGVSLPHDLFTRPRTIDSLAAIARGEATP